MRHEWDFASHEPIQTAREQMVAELSRTFDLAEPEAILEMAYDLHGLRLALVSSFGADAVVLLHMVSRIDPAFPVLLIDTNMLFEETLAYQTNVADHLGLRDVRRVTFDERITHLADPNGELHLRDPDACCHLRKTLPLDTELRGFDAWVTGRKRYQTAARQDMAVFELDAAGRTKVNPLARWSAQDVIEYIDRFDLPKHPLIARGFRSIGCAPCTRPVSAGEDPRAGRWEGSTKSECGIHFGPNGVQRGA